MDDTIERCPECGKTFKPPFKPGEMFCECGKAVAWINKYGKLFHWTDGSPPPAPSPEAPDAEQT